MKWQRTTKKEVKKASPHHRPSHSRTNDFVRLLTALLLLGWDSKKGRVLRNDMV